MLNSSRILCSILFLSTFFLLAGCAFPPKIEGAKCTGNVLGGWWKCEVTKGSYKKFEIGMRQNEIYNTLCSNSINRNHLHSTLLRKKNYKYSYKYPSYIDGNACFNEYVLYEYDVWDIMYDSIFISLEFKDGSLVKMNLSYSLFQP